MAGPPAIRYDPRSFQPPGGYVMAPTIDYYMTPSSPWTYLGSERFTQIARAAGATVNVYPVNFGKIFPATGGLPRPKGARTARLSDDATEALGQVPEHADHFYRPISLDGADPAWRSPPPAPRAGRADPLQRYFGGAMGR